ncbi:hypothetical protein L2E82_48291 [Cichorium intybus]|uniref:Uncharacterized protein n=1 Tax=Cichorium intybus TaxID=13427 RepID=A0ACB8YYY4_CICIN|nr:hypothetical protein L2E82_48291 [Cichorium intybus]
MIQFMGIKSPLPYQWRKYAHAKLRNGINFAYGEIGVTRFHKTFESLLVLVTVARNDYGAYTASSADQIKSVENGKSKRLIECKL